MRATAMVGRTVWAAGLALAVFTSDARGQSTTNRLTQVVNAVISGTTDPVTLVFTPGDAASRAPAFSPDRRLVLFSSAASNLAPAPDIDGGRDDLFVHVLATGRNVPITTDTLLAGATATHGPGVFSPVTVVVPEGVRYAVAFASDSPGPAGQPDPADTPGSHDLFVASFTLTPTGDVVDLTASPQTVATDVVPFDATGPTLTWSPDGTQVAFLATGNPDDHPFEWNLPEPNADVFVATVATRALARLTLNTGVSAGGAPTWPRALAWSPDGAAIAFHATTPDIDITGDGVSDVAPSTVYFGQSEVFLLRLTASPRSIERVAADPLTGDALQTRVGSFVGGFAPVVAPGQPPELFIATDILFPQGGQPAGLSNLTQVTGLLPAAAGPERWQARIVSQQAGGAPSNVGPFTASVAPVAATTETGRVMVGFSSTAEDLWDGAQGAGLAPQAYLADDAGAVALLSRAGGPRTPANGASAQVAVAHGRASTAEVSFLGGSAPQLWTLAAFETAATDIGPFVPGASQVVVSAVAPGHPATDDTFRATIERPTYMSYQTLLANDAPGLTFVGLIGATTGPTHFIQDDTGTQFVRFNHIGTAAETLSFQYEAQDVTGARFTSTVTMHVNNQRPLPAVDVVIPVTPGQTADVWFADVVSRPGNGDPDGDPLIVAYYQLVPPGTLGTLTGSPGSLHFTPAIDYTGGYALQYGLKDVVDYGGAESDSHSDLGTIRFVVVAPPPSIDFGGTVYSPPLEGTAPGPGGLIAVNLERRGDLSQPATVTYTLSAGQVPGATTDDIVGGFVSGSVTFDVNQVWAGITIRSTPDSLDEPDEYVLLTLTGATGATLARTTTYVTIYDDDLPQPPSASASGDQLLDAENAAGAWVLLSGIGIDPEGGHVDYAWSGACGVSQGPLVSFVCPLGVNIITLTTTDPTGLQGTDTVQVTVVDRTAPAIALTSPANGATYRLNQVVNALYSCTDAVGVSTCQGPVASGGAIDTSTTGAKSFTVTATDAAGNQRQEIHQYSVVPAQTTCRGLPDRQMWPFAPDGSTTFNRVPLLAAVFQACNSQGQLIGTPGFVTSFRLVRETVVATGVVVATNQAVATVPAGGFQFSRFAGYWYTVLDARRLIRGRRYEYLVTLQDGTAVPFSFSIR